jgi:hypothetical protein
MLADMERICGAVKVAECVEITDRASAQAWLETQDHQTQVWFAARCALRALPTLGALENATENGLALLGCRTTLISSAAASCPPAHMKRVEIAARYAADATARYTATAAVDAANAAAATAAAAWSFRTDDLGRTNTVVWSATANAAAAATSAARAAADSEIAATWSAASFDANAAETWGKLWPDAPQPEGLAQAWEALKAQWQADGPHWSFWIDWYEAVLEGKWTDWDLIFKIVTTLKDEDWDKGAAHVAKRIADIEDEYNAEQAAVEPEMVDPGNVVSLFDRAPIVKASMASLSETVSLRLDAFSRMQRPNETIPFFDALKSLPETADRIAKILEEGRGAPGAENALALEVGRLRAEVEQLKAALKSAHAELETLRKKPWYRSASILLPMTVVSSIATGLWVLSGDDKSLEHRWNKLAEDFEFLSLKMWPEPEDRINEPLRFELPKSDEA